MYIIYTHDFLDLYILVAYTHTSIFVRGLILQPVYKNKFSRLRTPDSCILTPSLAGKPPSYIIAQSNQTFPRNDWNISRNWPFPCAPVSCGGFSGTSQHRVEGLSIEKLADDDFDSSNNHGN